MAIYHPNHQLLDHMPLGYVEHEMVYDDHHQAINYRYIYVNPAFCRITGWKKKTVEGSLVKDLYPEVQQARIQHYQTLFEGRDVLDFETYFEKEDAWYQVRAYRSGEQRFVSIFFNVTDLKHMNQQLEYMSTHHLKTGLLNQQGLLESAFHPTTGAVCLYISIAQYGDLQNFYGHEFVYALTVHVAKELSQFHTHDDFVAQLGRSHFVVVLSASSQVGVKSVKATLSKLMAQPLMIENIDLYITLHIGIAHANQHTQTTEKLMHQAQMANKQAKNSDQNRFVTFKPQFHRTLKQNITLAKKLNDAITFDKMNQVFQTIINTKTNQPMFVESLARWEDDTYGPINPTMFFELAKRSYLVPKLERYLIDKTLKHYRAWLKDHDAVTLSLNLSPSFIIGEQAVPTLVALSDQYHIKHDDICIEISEETFMYDHDECIRIIKQFKAENFMIAIDDFGSKYSTIGLLDDVPFDVLKLDGLFAQNITSDNLHRLTSAIIKNMHALNKHVVAEKVATKKQAKALIQLKCYLHQGYLYDRGTLLKST